MTNAPAFLPQTPTPTRFMSPRHDHRPTKSSPLVPASIPASSSPGPVSPVLEVQARRKGQYKSRAPASTSVASMKSRVRFRKGPAKPIPFNLGPVTADAGQAAFLRERFKADCLERARRARERTFARRRTSATSDASSDGFDVDMNVDAGEDSEADDNRGFDDELFRRVVANEKRKRAHAYALSYELDVGSSFDPDIEDPTLWEEQLASSSYSRPSRQQHHASFESQLPPPPDDDGDDLGFDEYDPEEDGAWVDAYIAMLPLETIEAQIANSDSLRDECEYQQMDIIMG